MKHLIKKITIGVISIFTLAILTSFSSLSEREETISRNIEVLSQGEGGSSSTSCVRGEGRCIINGFFQYGMAMKH